MKSGMIYSEVMALTQQINSKADEIGALIATLQTEVVPQLEECYSGKAARRFNEVLSDQSKRIKDTIGAIAVELEKEANAQQEAYQDQDTNLQI